MAGSWKLLLQSVPGTSHVRAGQDCQDHASGKAVQAAGEFVLVLACADGAGSAARSDIGATHACDHIINRIVADLESSLKVAEIDQLRFQQWYGDVRALLEAEAAALNLPLREFACTLLTAVVGESCAAFAQIGDGAIVFADGEDYKTPIWPQNGEYINTTFFLTDEALTERMECQFHQGQLDELAMLTDGLETLVLNFGEKAVHAPFFSQMFKALRNTQNSDDLVVPLRQFLDSSPVNQRTDDDKTLVLATRRAADEIPSPV